ncbi:MAG: TolC family protein, partial [Deltaproteobacteria bacterium]|nr:TolC family protein [Deltaproteobacteria bacterium]
QYKEGLVDFQRVLDAQQNLVRQQDNWVATTGNVSLSLVALYKALGGGWEMRAGKDFVPDDIKAEMQKRTNWGNLLSPDEMEFPPSQEVDRLFNRPDW